MYSVLIQNQKTMESFQCFYPLFMDAIKEEKIGICQWMEAGETLKTAVPELYRMVDGKEEWRAIIIRIEDDSPTYPSVDGNPYDFIDNKSNEAFIKETPIPLIRLTRLLGGITHPPIRFETKVIQEINKAPRVIYEPTVDEEEQKAYKELCEKYHFDGVPPTEIILISLVIKKDSQSKIVQNAWKNEKEIQSSEFWKRNGYPSLCRFLVYNMQSKGMYQKNEDLFKVWVSVLLLATNEVDSSTMQAYRLLKLNIDFDKKIMEEVFQETVNRAKSAKQFIRNSIERELSEKIKEKQDIPKYSLEAPVVIDLPKKDDISINIHDFGLVSKNKRSDFAKWKRMRDKSLERLEDVISVANRALDYTADKTRMYCKYNEMDVKTLSSYQKEDMERELERTYNTIFEIRKEIPSRNSSLNRNMDELDKEVKVILQKYITKEAAAFSILSFIVLFSLSFIPAIVYNLKFQWGSKETLLIFIGSIAILLFLVEIITLSVFKYQLHKKIRKFNLFIKRIISQVAENGTRYSQYISNIATFTHGKSYLSILEKKSFLKDESEFHMRNHLIALDDFIIKLETWSTAFHLKVDFEREELNEGLMINFSIPPSINPIYRIDENRSHLVEVNHSGDYINSYFSFVKEISIVREGLYDSDE